MKKTLVIAIACFNPSGFPELIFTEIKATDSQIETGDHHLLAEKIALSNSYNGPFVCFDESDMPAFIKRAIAQGDLMELN